MIYFYYGDNIFALEQKLKAFKDRYEEKFTSGLNFWSIDLTENTETLSLAVETQPMFEEKKLVFARGAVDLKKEDWEAIEATIKKYDLEKSEDVVLVFFEKKGSQDHSNAGAGIDKRKKAFSYLSKKAKTQEFKTPAGAQLLSWAKTEVKKRGGSFSDSAVRELVDRTGPDTLRISTEIEKLITYSGKEKIEKKDVELLVSRVVAPNIFETLDHLAKRNVAAALFSFYQHTKQGDDPVGLLGMFIYETRTLLLVKEASLSVQGSANIAKHLKIHPFVARKNLGFVKNFSIEDLSAMHNLLAEADVAIKTGRKEPELALEDFIYSFL